MLRMLSYAVVAATVTASQAFALSLAAPPPAAPEVVVTVQMDCNPNRCLDRRTGNYTQSTCDARGCRPLGGVVGRVNPHEAAPQYAPRHVPGYGYDERPRYGGGGYGGGYGGGRGGFDCNPNRCIELSTGAVWESTCDYRGCRPLRPARRYR